MAIRFARSAVRHVISHARAREVIDGCRCPLYSAQAGDEDLVIFLGPDLNGVPLEVMGVELADDSIVVVHAMKLRQKYRDAFEQVMKCQDL